MPSVRAVLNGSLSYLYLLNWHIKDIKYDDFLSSFSLWYPEPEQVMLDSMHLLVLEKYH